MGLSVGDVAQVTNAQGEFVDVPARIVAATGFTMEVEIRDGSTGKRTLQYPTQVRECPPRLQSAFREEFGVAEPSPPAWQLAREVRRNTPLLRHAASSAAEPGARGTFDSEGLLFQNRLQDKTPMINYVLTGPNGIPKAPKNTGAIILNGESLREAIAKATGWSVGAVYFNGEVITDHHQYYTMRAAETQLPIVVCAEGEAYDAGKWAEAAHFQPRSSSTPACCGVM